MSLDRWLGMMDEGFVLDRVLTHAGPAVAGGRAARGPDRGRARDQGPAGNGVPTGRIPAQGNSVHENTASAPTATGSARNGAVSSGPAASGPAGHDVARNGVSRNGSAGGSRQDPQRSPYDQNDPVVNVERQALKLAIQRPALCGPAFDELAPAVFTVPAHAAVCELIGKEGGVASARSAREWAERLRAAAPNDNARGFVTRLAVEALEVPGASGEPDAKFAEAVLARVEELAVSRDIATVKSRLQRLSPVTEQTEYNRMFGDLVALEQRRKVLADRAAGAL